VALLAPIPALAHGESLLYMFVYVPPVIVPGAALLTTWSWRGETRAKLLTFLAIGAAPVVTTGTDLAIQDGRIPFPFGNDAYLGVVLAQVVVPGAVWFLVWRRVKLRGSADPT
jgi:hypothetical protein